jgi:hypothetical protein
MSVRVLFPLFSGDRAENANAFNGYEAQKPHEQSADLAPACATKSKNFCLL